MRLPYLRFAEVVARARREVLRTYPQFASVPVIPYSVDATVVDSEAAITWPASWGEFFLPDGPIIIYQAPYEAMADQENYYRQIKAVLRHEFDHARDALVGVVGHDNDPRGLVYARVRH